MNKLNSKRSARRTSPRIAVLALAAILVIGCPKTTDSPNDSGAFEQPVTQTVTIRIPNYSGETNGEIFGGTMANGDSNSYTFTITNVNKSDIMNWGTPSVTTASGNFAPANKPSFSVLIDDAGAGVVLTYAQKTKLDAIFNALASQLSGRNISSSNSIGGTITFTPRTSRNITISIPEYNGGIAIFNKTVDEGANESAAITITGVKPKQY